MANIHPFLKPRPRAAMTAIFCATLAAPVNAEEPQFLGRILLGLESIGEWVTGLGDGSASNTGKVVLGAASIETLGGGSTDANAAVAKLPNIQTANDIDDDAGKSVDHLLDTRPTELSIAGARTDQNNIMLDGIGINTVYGNINPITGDLSDETGVTNIYGIYGLHSQTQYVPSGLIGEAEVYDSNVSARYGGFVGGVVNYKLKKPSTRAAGGELTFGFSGDSMTSYSLGTEDGTNPGAVAKPEVSSLRYGLTLNQPLSDRSALLFSHSSQKAKGDKGKDAQFIETSAPTDSSNDFWHLAYSYAIDATSDLRLSASYTDYSHYWVSQWAEDYEIDQQRQNLLLVAEYEKRWEALGFLGTELRDVTLNLKASYQDNSLKNDTSADTLYYRSGAYYRYNSTTGAITSSYLTDDFDSYCDPASALVDWYPRMAQQNIGCYYGGFADRGIDDTNLKAEAHLDGSIWAGTFAMGVTVEEISAKRHADASYMFSTPTRLDSSAAYDSYICPEGDAACSDEQVFLRRMTAPAYDVAVDAHRAGVYLELDQTFGKFNVRGGLRGDYNDIMKNFDVAPRLAASWMPSESFSLTLGANRYYDDEFMTYAINDALPRGYYETRTVDAATGEVSSVWSPSTVLTDYSYTQSGLKTPFSDELTLSLNWADSWTGGDWRLGAMHREGKDGFARSQGGSTVTGNVLSNDGRSTYDSVKLEYNRQWKAAEGKRLDYVGLYFASTWSDRWVSNDSVFASTDEAYYYYNGQSYSADEFGVVRGNADIPVRSTIEVRGSWDHGKYELGLGAEVNFAYQAVVDSGSTITATNANGYTGAHDIYEDRDMDTAVKLNLSARVRLAEVRGNPLDLNLYVENLLDDVGNATATSSRPWMDGRKIWVGATYTW